VTVPGSQPVKDAPASTVRRVLLVVNTRRRTARQMAQTFCGALGASGIKVRLLEPDSAALRGPQPTGAVAGHMEVAPADSGAAEGCELVVVIGGDGTILRAAELTRGSATPLLGINLGHVGFLAEAEAEDVDRTIQAIIDQAYVAEERLTVDVEVFQDGTLVASTWALNEASVEKAARERMLELVVEVDGRPLSRWGCDGVVCSTPTGSTAYNFSAGGPVVWPEVEALLIVPISAHALFARPLVVAPTSVLAVELVADTEGAGVLWCDGRRMWELAPGSRVEVRRGRWPVRLARLHAAPFTDRLVAKFELPVSGWRGAAARRLRGEATR